MAIKTFVKGTNAKLSNNFQTSEFACKGSGCCKTVKIDDKLINFLQKIRDHFGEPVTITSAYRCATHNKNIGGASGSYHVKGQAADIVVRNIKPAKVAEYAEKIGVLGIGLYEGSDGDFVHIDTRVKKSFWYGHKQEYRSTFGGASSEVVTADSTIKAWQKAAIADGYSMPSGADGIWGKECEAASKKAICKRCYWPWKNKNLTKIIQKAVGVEADGKFGVGTKAAVIKWQRLTGLTADGIVGYNTWKKILGI